MSSTTPSLDHRMKPTHAPRVRAGEVLEVVRRPGPPVRVTDAMITALPLLRSALVAVARTGGTMSYSDASRACGGVYPAVGMGRVLDVLTIDCARRDEPSLAALVVRSGGSPDRRGDCGEEAGFAGDAAAERERCWRRWGGPSGA